MNVTAEETSYTSSIDNANVRTYLARPAGSGPFPALLMAYEFWGMLNVPGGGPHMRDVAQRFAAEGYVAAVPDYYAARGQQPTMQGGTISGGPSYDESVGDLCQGVRWLATLPFVSRDRIGVIGWCGGGRQAVFLAARCSDVRAAASFYGRPINRPNMEGPSPIDLVEQIGCPIFGAYGEADHAIPVDSVHKFKEALDRHRVVNEINVYPGAGHAFMNDQRDGYHQPSATDAWRKVLAFFERHLKSAAT